MARILPNSSQVVVEKVCKHSQYSYLLPIEILAWASQWNVGVWTCNHPIWPLIIFSVLHHFSPILYHGPDVSFSHQSPRQLLSQDFSYLIPKSHRYLEIPRSHLRFELHHTRLLQIRTILWNVDHFNPASSTSQKVTNHLVIFTLPLYNALHLHCPIPKD